MVDLSESARTILRHFKVRGMHEKDYETPAALGQLFNHPQECESAEAELVTAGLVDLAAGSGGQKWNRNRIRGAALTLDGERYVQTERYAAEWVAEMGLAFEAAPDSPGVAR
jgi:hypothetical protein